MVWFEPLVERLIAASQLLTLLAAYGVGVWFLEREADNIPGPAVDLGSLTTWLGLGALIGGRLGFAFPNASVYLRFPLDLLYITTGLSFYGGLVGVLLAALWFSRRHGLSLGVLLDLSAPATLLGIAVYRLTCLVRGDCGGAVAASPWGVVFPGASVPRYPVEIWEGLLALALFGLLYRWRGRWRAGALALSALIVYPLMRASIALFRLNLDGWLTSDQTLSLLTAALAGLVWLWRGRGTLLRR